MRVVLVDVPKFPIPTYIYDALMKEYVGTEELG